MKIQVTHPMAQHACHRLKHQSCYCTDASRDKNSDDCGRQFRASRAQCHVEEYRQREKEPSKTSFDLDGSEIYLQDDVNGRAYARHLEPNSQCYESSLGTKRTSLHKWVYVSVIFSAHIKTEEATIWWKLLMGRTLTFQSINDCQD